MGKDKGKFGVISSIIKERNWVYVEGLNAVSRSLLVWGTVAQWLAQHSHKFSVEILFLPPVKYNNLLHECGYETIEFTSN